MLQTNIRSTTKPYGLFVENYIKDVPWKKHPLFAFSPNKDEYGEAFKAVLENTPIPGTEINYNDNKWDFQPYLKTAASDISCIVFNGFPNEILDMVKFFVLFNITQKKKISTMSVRVSCIKKVFAGLLNINPLTNFQTISTNDIVEYVDQLNAGASSKHSYYVSMFQFYDFIEKNYRLKVTVNLKELNKKSAEYKIKAKKNCERIPNIPSEYLQKIITTATSIMRDTNAPNKQRCVACLLLILSQTGLRTGDLLELTVDRLKEVKLGEENLKVNYIHYTARKPSKAHNKLLEFDIVSNPLCTEAFETLLELRKKNSFHKKYDFLFMPEESKYGTTAKYPIQKNIFRQYTNSFFYTYLRHECSKEWEGVKPISYQTSKEESGTSKKRVTIYVPENRQYRVAVCTQMYERGVPLVYIQRFMGHLTEYMQGYYVRPADNTIENLEFSEKTISSIVKDDNTPIGFMGDEMKKRINEFLKNGKISVQDDIDDILTVLGDRVIIRAKEGGVCACIKTSFMPCSHDARSNEALCAYGNCLNIYTFYYNADLSYGDFITALQSYQHNKDIGKKREAERELVKAKDICKRRLLPQLEELEKELQKKGRRAILDKYPTLSEIITNKDVIKKEVQECLIKKA